MNKKDGDETIKKNKKDRDIKIKFWKKNIITKEDRGKNKKNKKIL